MDVLEALFSSRVRVSLLRVLLADPEREFYGRELARHAGERQSAVWRELQNLESAGLLERRERGAVTYLRVRADFPILQELRRLFARADGRSIESPRPATTARPRVPYRPQIVVGEDD